MPSPAREVPVRADDFGEPGTAAAAANGPAPRLRFRDLHRRFGRLAVLRGVSGGAAAGEVLLVTGANGSGKSTLLRCLAGLLAPDSGEVDYRETAGDGGSGTDGPRPFDAAERRRRVGYVAPDLALYEELTTGENLAFFSRLRGVPEARGPELLERLGLPADRPAGALSSGMRQKLRWAWALLHRPRLLLLDEPFQNLDAAGEAAVRELLAAHLAGAGDGDGDGGDPPAAPGLAVLAQPVDVEIDPRWKVAERVELAG